MQIRTLTLAVVLIWSSSCREDAPSDLERISKAHCTVIKMCDPFNFDELWESLDACEAYSADEFAVAMAEDKDCFDARLAWETCMSMAMDCNDYEGGPGCSESFSFLLPFSC